MTVSPVGTWTDAHVVARDGTDEGFGHSVAPRTFDRGSRFETDVAGKAAGIAGDVTAGWCLDGRCPCQNRDKLRVLLSLGFGRRLKDNMRLQAERARGHRR
jgi:hypothetical protein